MTIDEAIRAQLLAMDAVKAITTTIRPIEIMQTDRSPHMAIQVVKKIYENTIDGVCNLVSARVLVSSCSGNKAQADDLAEAIRTNKTEPGTGLAGCTVRTGGLPFQAMLTEDTFDYIANQDGSNTGRFIVDSMYVLTFDETT